jgi:hypothetical protein
MTIDQCNYTVFLFEKYIHSARIYLYFIRDLSQKNKQVILPKGIDFLLFVILTCGKCLKLVHGISQSIGESCGGVKGISGACFHLYFSLGNKIRHLSPGFSCFLDGILKISSGF